MSVFVKFISAILIFFQLQGGVPNQEVKNAFVKAQAETVLGYAQEKVFLDVLDANATFSQSQAEQILKKFFDANPNGEFKYTFEGEPNGQGAVSIANYEASGRVFEVTFEYKKVKGDFKIERITIE